MLGKFRLALVTDAWAPQVNGVVNTFNNVIPELERRDVDVAVVHPSLFRTVRLPRYSEVRLAIEPVRIYRALDNINPDFVHIATEGPLGTVARFWCGRRGFRFTTSYHTRFPEYVKEMYGFPSGPVTAYMRWFHGGAEHTLVPTQSVKDDLQGSGFRNLVVWPRGVDSTLFHPSARTEGWYDLANPQETALVYVGRVSREKSVDEFCELASIPGHRCWVVGDGPHREELEQRYGDRVAFVGFKRGHELAQFYASADVMVFPSRTDTFGNVITESMACGTPVAAYPVTGPRDVVADGISGALDDDLAAAVRRAMACDREQVREYALHFSWESCAGILHDALTPVR